MWIRPLAAADASCGAKAHGLARLGAAGLRVPEGFVIEPAAFAAIAGLPDLAPDREADGIGQALGEAARRIAEAALPAAVEHEVRTRAAALGRLAVRSSAAVEDGALGAAAGVFASITDVAPDDVWSAVRAVWTSALTPLAVTYARRHAAMIAISVIVQRFVPGARATVYTRPVGAPAGDALWLQRGEQIDRVPRATAAAGDGVIARAAQVALAAETIIGAAHGADVELVIADGASGAGPDGASGPGPDGASGPDDRPWVVQARPIVHPVRQARRSPPPILLAPLVADGRRWAWDITHNPDPLSPAQAGLVEHVERAGAAPYAARVCCGYLYTTPGATPPVPAPPEDAAELAARVAAIEARFTLDDAGEAAQVATAVERYVAFVRIWAFELSPLVAAARRPLLDRLARDGHAANQVAARAAALIGPRRAPRDPVMSPAWDVAVPTFAERAPPSVPDPANDPGRPSATPARADAERASREVALARAAADAAEHDDVWFARAQWMVRRALLAYGRACGLAGNDVFWLALDDVIACQRDRHALDPIDPIDAHRRAAAARAAHARAAAWDMPRVIHGEAISHAVAPEAGDPTARLHGVGEGPRIVGRVVRFASLADAAPVRRGDVVVTRAITPALAMVVEGCAALVSETGGLLDHGAAMARELGIPCVVGCAHAWSQLTDGALVCVDGDAGTVEPM